MVAVAVGAWGRRVAASRAVAHGVGPRRSPWRPPSLTQNGQQLVWHVGLDAPVRAGGAAAGSGRSLCLADRAGSERQRSGVLCVEPPAPAARPQLVYQRVTGLAGAARAPIVGADRHAVGRQRA